MPRICALAALILALCVANAACSRDADAASARARAVYIADGFLGPESVRYDPVGDAYFISNIRGYGSVKDGNGYIVRMDAADPRQMTVFVEGGKNGAVLDAPKGMTLRGDTLWVADIDVVRGFDRRTGEPVANVDLRPHGAMLLNDIAVGPDGALYVTDSGIIMSDMGVMYQDSGRIYSIAPDRSVSIMATGPALQHPNGITWDTVGNRWIVVSFAPFRSEVYTLGSKMTDRAVLSVGRGRFDGVEVLGDGRIIFTAWNDSSLHVLAGDSSVRAVYPLWQPADIGVDTKRGRVAIPQVLPGRVELWELPPR